MFTEFLRFFMGAIGTFGGFGSFIGVVESEFEVESARWVGFFLIESKFISRTTLYLDGDCKLNMIFIFMRGYHLLYLEKGTILSLFSVVFRYAAAACVSK